MTEVIIYNILYIIMLPSNKTMFIDEPSGAAMDLILGELDRASHLFIRDQSFDRDRVSYEKIRGREDVEFLVKSDHIHPEAVGLVSHAYQVAGTINWGPMNLRADSIPGETKRKLTTGRIMNYLRVRLGLNGKKFVWVATTEYGYENRPHGHFLISFDGVTNPSKVPSAETCRGFLQSILHDLAVESDEPCLGEILVQPVTNSPGAVAYLCKEEYRRPHKAFYYSTSLTKQ